MFSSHQDTGYSVLVTKEKIYIHTHMCTCVYVCVYMAWWNMGHEVKELKLFHSSET